MSKSAIIALAIFASLSSAARHPAMPRGASTIFWRVLHAIPSSPIET